MVLVGRPPRRLSQSIWNAGKSKIFAEVLLRLLSYYYSATSPSSG